MYSPKNLCSCGAVAGLLGKMSSKWVDPQAYGPTHLIEEMSSEWNRGLFPRQSHNTSKEWDRDPFTR